LRGAAPNVDEGRRACRFEQLDLPALSALASVKLDLAEGPQVPTATIEAAIRTWGEASQKEFSGLSKLPLSRTDKRDVASDRHWTSLLVEDLENYHDGHFPNRTNGDLARHNAAAAKVDHDFGVKQSG
jgi:hypothetical protein